MSGWQRQRVEDAMGENDPVRSLLRFLFRPVSATALRNIRAQRVHSEDYPILSFEEWQQRRSISQLSTVPARPASGALREDVMPGWGTDNAWPPPVPTRLESGEEWINSVPVSPVWGEPAQEVRAALFDDVRQPSQPLDNGEDAPTVETERAKREKIWRAAITGLLEPVPRQSE